MALLEGGADVVNMLVVCRCLQACRRGLRNAERGGVLATIDTLLRYLLAAVAISK